MRLGLSAALIAIGLVAMSYLLSRVTSIEYADDIEFLQPEYAVGELEEANEPAQFSVFVTSKTGGIPKVDRVSTSCGCVFAEVIDRDVNERTIEIRLGLARDVPDAKAITITACAKGSHRCCSTQVLYSVKGRVTATIKGNVLGGVAPSSTHLVDVDLESGKVNVEGIKITVAGLDEISRYGTSAAIERIEKTKFRVSVQVGSEIGYRSVFIRIIDAKGNLVHREIPISWEVRESIWTSPKTILLTQESWSGKLLIGFDKESVSVSDVVGEGVSVDDWSSRDLRNGYTRLQLSLSRQPGSSEPKTVRIVFSDGFTKIVELTSS